MKQTLATSSDQRVALVAAALNGITDPCSASFGVPIGIVEMGIVDEIEIDDGAVSVQLLPTFPGCLFLGMFESEIEDRLEAFDWCSSVSVSLAAGDVLWSEDRLSERARVRLGDRRSQARTAFRRSRRLKHTAREA